MLEVGLAPVRIEVVAAPPGSLTAASPARPAAAASPPPTAAPAPPPPAAAGGPGRLSLGVFPLERNARWMERQIAPRFAGTAVEPVTLEGADGWRVTVRAADAAEAERIAAELAEMGLKARPVR
jgi:hypothetical protein